MVFNMNGDDIMNENEVVESINIIRKYNSETNRIEVK